MPRSPLEQLALPLLTTTAWRMPARWPPGAPCQRMTVCDGVWLVVKVPAATQGASATSIAISGVPGSDLMPQEVLPARKPLRGGDTALHQAQTLGEIAGLVIGGVRHDAVLLFEREHPDAGPRHIEWRWGNVLCARRVRM